MLSCSYENTATVTIDTGIRKQAQLSLIDKVIAWFSLSKAVQADPVPSYLYIYSIAVNVSASDMQTIKETIPLDTGKITLEVPAGSQRTFEVVGYDEAERRYYGGIATVDLQPGQNVNLDIKMGELNNKFYYFYYYTATKTIDTVYSNTEDPTADMIAFKIYKSPDDSYNNETLFAVVTQWERIFNSGEWTITISKELPGLDTYTTYYRISNVNEYGEGEKILITLY